MQVVEPLSCRRELYRTEYISWAMEIPTKDKEGGVSMKSGNEIDVDVLSHFENEASASDLPEFLEFVRQHRRLETISYVWPARSVWLIKNSCLALAYSDAWLDQCSAKGRAAEQEDNALDWGFISRLDAAIDLTRRESQFSVARSRMIIPLRGTLGSLDALVGVTVNEPEESWPRRRPALFRDLTNVAHYIHQRAELLCAGGRNEKYEALTSQEIESLACLADGVAVSDIATAMRVSDTVARAYLDSARWKLGALTLSQATAKALRQGLI